MKKAIAPKMLFLLALTTMIAIAGTVAAKGPGPRFLTNCPVNACSSAFAQNTGQRCQFIYGDGSRDDCRVKIDYNSQSNDDYPLCYADCNFIP